MADDSTKQRGHAPRQARPVAGGRARENGPAAAEPRSGVEALQRAAGNQAVSALLARGTTPLAADGAREEELERRADRDADAIVALAGGAGGAGDDGRVAGIAGAAERVLGRSMRDVRVHHDATARAATDAHEARAIAAGRDVYVAPDQWSPGTRAGGHLLAHELAHTAQQATSGVAAVQAQKRPGAKDDEEESTDDADEESERPARVVSCPGGAMPYNGVCLTDEILDVLPVAGDVHEAERLVERRAEEKRSQAAVQKRYAKLSDAELSKKIAEMRQRAEGSGSAPSLLRRLENERNRRRALPISDPTTVDQAIAMLEEAWSLAEKEEPPDLRRAAYLVHVVNRWLQKAAPASRYEECFSGFARTTAMQTVGMAKGNVADLEAKFRLGASIGGWWPATINSLRVARELVQIMSGEKRIEDTSFDATSKLINKTAVATPLVGAAIMAAPVLIVAAPEIPALPATIGGVNTAVWGQALFGATLSASYLSHVVTRSKESVESGKGSNPLSIASAAMLDASGVGGVVESARNKSILTGEDLHRSKAERVVGVIAGAADVVMNFFGAKDVVAGSPSVFGPRAKPEPPAPPRAPEPPAGSNVTTLPAPSRTTVGPATEAEVARATETGAATPIGSAGRAKPPVTPPTTEAQTAVAQQPVQDVDVSGNLALKRETGGGPSGGASNAGGETTVAPKAVRKTKGSASGTGTTGTARTGGTTAPRDVGGPRTVPAPPGRVGPGGKQITQEYPPQAWHDIAEIEANHPDVKAARLRPVYRGAGRGKFDERMKTSGTSYSFEAEMPNGKTIELDTITTTKRGVVIDNKDLKSLDQRWAEFEGNVPRGERPPRDVYDQITGAGDARVAGSRARFRAQILDEVSRYGKQLQAQSDFISAYHLPGGEWQVPDAGWKKLLDAELKARGITNIKIVVHE